ncbi:hypothetical protein [Pedobacter frigiditerrae]|uniref:hypothetical protein n=1 Tax=Pedobacter frigiditerrae TaxID=2530452 RepID=UPI00292F9B29|nr:hypothetical protein [Pedobacter frigiditerrae]
MRKNVTLVVLLFAIISLVAYSQASNLKTATYRQNAKYIYCELIQQDYFFSVANNKAFLRFGAKSRYQNQSEESEYIKLEKNGIDALNYMSEKEWDFVTKDTREITNGVENIYLLRKKK